MTQSQTAVYNLAVGACGGRSAISSPTESSREAQLCQTWYEPVRRVIFRSAHWNSIEAHSRLGLLVERDAAEDWVTSDPSPGYAYKYSAPSDMIKAWHLTTYQPFKIENDHTNNVRVLHTDVADVVLTYGKDVTDISLWDASMYMAVVYGLAAHICRPLTGKSSRANELIGASNQIIMNARVDSANEQATRRESLPDWIAARGYAGGPGMDRYIVPYGSVLNMMGAPVV